MTTCYRAAIVRAGCQLNCQLRSQLICHLVYVSPLPKHVMRPLRYSINVTLDGCCDHRAIPADEDLHRHAADTIARADALLFGRVTYEMMEAAWRAPARAGERPEWMQPW